MLYPSPLNSRRLIAKWILPFLVLLVQGSLGALGQAEGTSESPDSNARAVTINFDTLQTNIVLPVNQYQIASFSSYAGGTIYTQYDCQLGGSCPNGIVATSGSGYSYWPTADVYVNFAMPVNGLTFRVLGSQAGGSSGQIDVYVNNSYYTSTGFYSGPGYPGQLLPPLTVNLSGIQHVTGIAIRYVQNYDYWFYSNYLLYYDDFTFTPELTVDITNPRVSGGLDQTTRNALLGADIALQATAKINGASVSGGAYAWTFTGSPVSVSGGGQNATAITIRSIDTGTITAKVTYTLNGVSVTATVTINSILPTLTSFTVPNRSSDRINSPGTCGHTTGPDSLFWWYDLGCKPSSVGISFSSNIQVPTFLSDPAQSGVKYVQAVNTFRKKISGGMRCDTRRSTETDLSSGWQLDTSDPFKRGLGELQYFTIIGSPGFTNGFSIGVDDYPGRSVTGFVDYDFLDSLYIDERFQMYIVYFTGPEPSQPWLQRPLGMMEWNWGGTVVFDEPGYHHVRSSNAPYQIAHIFDPSHQNMSSMVTMDGNVTGNEYHRCPSGPELTNNLIDSSRVFVRFHYIDFLGRDPDGNPNDPNDPNHPTDLPGWKFWTSQISKCAFDLNCIHAQRVNDGLAFFLSGEFIGTDPDLANPPGSPGFNPAVYNRAFVKYCYLKYLHRNPVFDPDGWKFWTDDLNSNGNYAHTIDAFISCADYRGRGDFTTVSEKF